MRRMAAFINSGLIKSVGIYTLSSLINASIPFFLLPLLTRYLSPREYAIVAMFQVAQAFYLSSAGLSTQSAITRQYYDKNADIKRYIFNALVVLLATWLINALITSLLGVELTKALGLSQSVLQLCLMSAVAQSVVLILLALWQVSVKPISYGVYQISITIMNIAVSLMLVISLRRGAEGRIAGIAVSYIFFGILALAFLFRKGWIKPRISGSDINHLLRYCLPLIPHVLAASIIVMADRVLVANLVGLSDAGIYVVGAEIGGVVALLQTAFNRAWVPWFFEKLSENSDESNRVIVKITYLYNVTILSGAIIFIIGVHYSMGVLVGGKFRVAEPYIVWIAIGYAFNGMYKMVTNYIYYVEKTYILAYVTVFVAVLNVSIVYTLVSAIGPIGAAQGTMIAWFVSYLLTWYIAAKLHPMPWNLFKSRRRGRAL